VSWKVLVDGARNGRTLYSALTTSNRLNASSVCIFAELAEREATVDLLQQGVRGVWYLEDQDVSVPTVHQRATLVSANPLTRFVARQSNHWDSIQATHLVADPFLEAVAACVQDRVKARSEDPAMQALDYAIAVFIRQATAYPLSSPDRQTELLRQASKIVAQASVLAAFMPTAATIRDLFRKFVTEAPIVEDRRDSLAEIVYSAADEVIAVVCRSGPIADACCASSQTDPMFSGLTWTSMERLRRDAPFDRLLVPGWLDRRAMREIASNGLAGRTDFVLFPFEKTWLDNVLAASRKWERRLEGETIETLRSAALTFQPNEATPSHWTEQTRKRLQKVDNAILTIEADDKSDADILEERAIEALASSVNVRSNGQPTTRAQLVLLEEPGAYIFLPPHGRTIVLRSRDELTAERPKKSDAESELFRNVSELAPGMVLAVPETTDRDLVDARADQFLPSPARTRMLAGLWKTAIRKKLREGTDDFRSLSQKMKVAGESRDPGTIRSWATDSKSVAPRNYKHVVPLLAELTGDSDLGAQMSDVLSAIDLMYRARERAAEALLHDIFSGEINIDAPELTISLPDGAVSFALHRVRQCAGIKDVPTDRIGRVERVLTPIEGAPLQ
jgi:hypothetical protein